MSTSKSKKSIVKRVRGALRLGRKDNSPVPRAGADGPAENYGNTATGFENTGGQSQSPLGQDDRNSTVELAVSYKSPSTVSASGDTERQEQHATAQQIKFFPNMSNNKVGDLQINNPGRDLVINYNNINLKSLKISWVLL
ncbi:hypothetical protein K435DRAFT_839193 [Dendrothele bispora CBS 962.96]|uniref:Uncharacterized protein n=1 Tax=Dendrothele bispora (strain CBS 962.96) TaxID=1314807 RepID=A0A4S8M1V7_DENBC|nr:hypothetical protein K435DRAFT_839193 [Dendrothele bispora CBS 962.96]